MIDSGISKVLQAADQYMINRYSHQLNVSDQFFFYQNWFSSACGCKASKYVCGDNIQLMYGPERNS